MKLRFRPKPPAAGRILTRPSSNFNADHWFSTTLVGTQSFGVRNHVNWRNDDTLEVTLGFGCLKSATREVDKVGSIRIYYHFSDGDTELARGCPD